MVDAAEMMIRNHAPSIVFIRAGATSAISSGTLR